MERLAELKEIGADQFAIYLMHDQPEQTLAAYADKIIPRGLWLDAGHWFPVHPARPTGGG